MNKKRNQKTGIVWFLTAAVAVLFLFYLAVRNVNEAAARQGSEHLERALRQAAVACYAAEGIYPPNTAYLQEHYGVQIDEERYLVSYEIFADNLMPDITVWEKES